VHKGGCLVAAQVGLTGETSMVSRKREIHRPAVPKQPFMGHAKELVLRERVITSLRASRKSCYPIGVACGSGIGGGGYHIGKDIRT
jgi:hypothetical protein